MEDLCTPILPSMAVGHGGVPVLPGLATKEGLTLLEPVSAFGLDLAWSVRLPRLDELPVLAALVGFL